MVYAVKEHVSLLFDDCLNNYLVERAKDEDQVEEFIENAGAFSCLMHNDGCEHVHKLEDFQNYLKDETRVVYIGKIFEAQKIKKIRDDQHEAAVNSRVIAPEVMMALFPNAKMCFKCGTGPIDHYKCAALNTHHNEAVGKSRINNSCPNCGWFANTIGEWPKWNGIMKN